MKYLVSYESHRRSDVIHKLGEYGDIFYESPIINVIGVETEMHKDTIERIVGVTRVDIGFRGHLY